MVVFTPSQAIAKNRAAQTKHSSTVRRLFAVNKWDAVKSSAGNMSFWTAFSSQREADTDKAVDALLPLAKIAILQLKKRHHALPSV